MRLQTIIEDINRQEFYDFYALLYASQEESNRQNPEITQHLKAVTDHIFNDHMAQFANMLFNRVPDPDHDETVQLLDAYGLTTDEEAFQITGSENLTVQQQAELLKQILALNHKHGFTGDTWFGLANTFIKLANTNPSLNQRILAIDKIYNLLHHGGQITDYMDENDWLEDALNTRDNANPAQIFALASSQVRSLIGRSSYVGQNRGPVSDIDKLYTSLRRLGQRHEGLEVVKTGNQLDITVSFATMTLTIDGKDFKHPTPVWGSKPSARLQQMVKPEHNAKIGPTIQGKLSVLDSERSLIITDGKVQIPVPKPINRQLSLAYDLLWSAVSNAEGRSINVGSGISSIKPSYYYINGRRIKL